MTHLARLFRQTSGAAAAELALALPLLLVLICGSVELGNYFLDEHRLIKAVRDGARFAARQDLSYFTGCSGNPGGTVVSDTQNIVMSGLLTGIRLACPIMERCGERTPPGCGPGCWSCCSPPPG